MFKIEPVPGKGYGCIAQVDINKGERILREKPVLYINTHLRSIHFKFIEENSKIDNNIKGEENVQKEKDKNEFLNVVNEFWGLDDCNQKKILELSHERNKNNDEAILEAFKDFDKELPYETFHRICNIYATNTFNNGIFLTMSRFNHSCWPNAECFWNSETKTRDLVSLDYIKNGEEINHNYLQRSHFRNRRQTLLLSKWNIHCDCRLCSINEHDDFYRKEFITLESQLLDKCIDHDSLDINVEVLTKVKGARLLTVLKLLDNFFLKEGRKTFLDKNNSLCSIIVLYGLKIARNTYGSDSIVTKMWQKRKDNTRLCVLIHFLKSLTESTIGAFAISLLLWNFYNLNCYYYIMLLLALLLQKIL